MPFRGANGRNTGRPFLGQSFRPPCVPECDQIGRRGLRDRFSPPSQCVGQAAAQKEPQILRWRGPFVVREQLGVGHAGGIDGTGRPNAAGFCRRQAGDQRADMRLYRLQD